MIIKNEYVDSFNELTFNLSLIEFAMCIAKIFNSKKVKVICAKSGTYNSENFITPKVNESTSKWIKKIILVKNDDIYDLERWCN